MANHAVVMARLIVKGKDYGPQTFVVQIRESGSHQPMPGVELGDLGPKLGYENKDNGYAIFTHLRIPRSALLNRYISVSTEGEVRTHGNPKIGYFTMLYNRILILLEAPEFSMSCVTIALRYSAYRRQFRTQPGSGEEGKVLDY